MKSVTKTIQIPETLEDFTKIDVFIDSLARLNDESNIKNAHARIDDRFGDVQTPDDRVKAHAVLDFFTICLAMVHALNRMPLGAFDQTISGVISGVEHPYRKYAEMMWETLRAKNDNIYAYDVDVFPFCVHDLASIPMMREVYDMVAKAEKPRLVVKERYDVVKNLTGEKPDSDTMYLKCADGDLHFSRKAYNSYQKVRDFIDNRKVWMAANSMRDVADELDGVYNS